MMFLILAIVLPLLAIGGLLALVWLLATSDVPVDIGTSRGNMRAPSLIGRLRAWLTSAPKRLDYRRDRKGRFRRVRRG
jgi:hypothetical protein